MRQEIVRLLCNELEMIEPWAAASRKTTTAPCTDPRFVGAVFQTDRAWLVLPIPSEQFETATSTVRWPSFVVAGAPDSFRAFVLTPGGVHLAERSERVAGGVMATLASPDPAAALVLLRADDAKLIERLRRNTDAPGAADGGGASPSSRLGAADAGAPVGRRRVGTAAGSGGRGRAGKRRSRRDGATGRPPTTKRRTPPRCSMRRRCRSSVAHARSDRRRGGQSTRRARRSVD